MVDEPGILGRIRSEKMRTVNVLNHRRKFEKEGKESDEWRIRRKEREHELFQLYKTKRFCLPFF